jgi:hypothetical protein
MHNQPPRSRTPPRPSRDCGEWQAIHSDISPAPQPPRAAQPQPPSPPPFTTPFTITPPSPTQATTPKILPPSTPPLSPPLKRSRTPLVGTLLEGRYLVTKLIASGGQARVYKADDTLFRRDVAIRVFHGREQADIDAACEQNRWAVAALAQIKSPHLVETIDLIRVSDRAYHHVMEFIDGETLADYLLRHGPITWRRAAQIGIQLCDALIALHEHNPQGRRECITPPRH